MRSSRIALLFGLASGLVYAAGSSVDGQEVSGSSHLQLEFIDGTTAKATIGVVRKIKWTGEKPVDDPATDELAKQDKSNALAEKCGVFPPPPSPAQSEELLLPLLIPIAVEVINWAIQEVATLVMNYGQQKLDAAVKAYTRTWSTKAETDFYSHFANNTTSGIVDYKSKFSVFDPMKEAVFCIHYTRYENSPKLASDFLATIKYDPAKPDVITIRPFRIFYSSFSSLVAKPDSENVAVKIDFSADVTYLERQQGAIAKGAIDGTILAAQFDRSKLRSPNDSIYVVYKDTAPGLTVPLPPWSLEWRPEEPAAAPAAAAAPIPVQTPQDDYILWPKHNRLSAAITVSEVGSVPKLLKDAADWFDKNKSDATKGFISALQSFASSVDGLGKKSSPASTGGATATH
jgi:hypothetical protein